MYIQCIYNIHHFIFTPLKTIIQARVPRDKKEKVKKILDSMGMDISTAINLYLSAIVKEEGIPFPVTTKSRQDFLDQLQQGHDEFIRGKSHSLQETKKLLGI